MVQLIYVQIGVAEYGVFVCDDQWRIFSRDPCFGVWNADYEWADGVVRWYEYVG